MTNGHFETAYWTFLRKIQSAGGVACEDNPDIFFPEDFPERQVRQIATAAARSLCRQCPINPDCLKYAIETNQKFGIWAGTTPSDRNGN